MDVSSGNRPILGILHEISGHQTKVGLLVGEDDHHIGSPSFTAYVNFVIDICRFHLYNQGINDICRNQNNREVTIHAKYGWYEFLTDVVLGTLRLWPMLPCNTR